MQNVRNEVAPATSQDIPHAEIRSRALQSFEYADLLKPDEGTAQGPAFDLAPLILEERLSATASFLPADYPLPVEQPANDHSPEPFCRKLYHSTSTANLDGRDYDQLTYFWNDMRAPAPGGGSWIVTFRAIRLTRDGTGFPLVYELFEDHPKQTKLFVSQSLERAAAAEFGVSLPGRISSLERSLEETPDALVVRVLEDGPVPMGPFVYVAGPERSIVTLSCRCMPSQVKNIVHNVTYCLWSPDEAAASRRKNLFAGPLFPPRQNFPKDFDDPSRLQRILRWPHGL